MTNQDWREHVDGLMALLLILKEGQRAFVEDNVKPFIDLEIRIAEERGYRNGIREATEEDLEKRCNTVVRACEESIEIARNQGRREVIEELEKFVDDCSHEDGYCHECLNKGLEIPKAIGNLKAKFNL